MVSRRRTRLLTHDRTNSFLPEPLEPRMLLAADPIAPDHPLWLIPRGAAVIDGIAGDAGWVNAGEVFRTQATRDDRAVVVKMMYDDNGIYLLAQVEDFTLWADGLGAGAGNRWEVETDDSITFYFDPDNSRDEYFQSSDRAFGVNLANPSDPLNRSDGGAVRRYKFVHGTGSGGAPDVNPGGALDAGMLYATVFSGTVNNNADQDAGWTTELFLPWAALNMAGAPVHGQTIGLNFDMIQDNAGGDRDLTDHREASDRFSVPHFIDDHVQGVHSSYTATQAGIRGPVNYAEAMFVNAQADTRPAPIAAASASNITSFGATINFTAPAGTTAGTGHVVGYLIRYASAVIDSEATWINASAFENQFVPRLRGLAESLRISELAPATTYHLAIRAIGADGNLADLSTDISFTTLASPGNGYAGYVIPSPNGRTLQFENGAPFIPVGDHLGISWTYTRTLFPGLIWDNAHSQFVNFSDDAHRAVEDIGDYLDSLQAHGINTMRTYLELENVHTLGNPGPLPTGTYWIENTPNSFNPNMRLYVLELLQQAASRGIHVILSPFDTFSYDEAFGVEGPWAASRGGPLTDINHFFQSTLGAVNTSTLDIAKRRMKTVIDWVAESPYKQFVLGYEFLSEWDSYEWTLHPSGGGEPGRETEFRTRAVYMNQLAAYVKSQAPNALVLNSTIARDPRGPLARLDFLSRNFDALTPHLYTNGNEEGINNPESNTSILPAREMGYFTAYWITNREDHAPILNGEWGMTRTDWPGGVPQYSPQFTQTQDEDIFRTVIWSGFASGQVGTGLRIAADEVSFNGYLLTDGMRDLQKTFSTFVNSSSIGIDFTNFNYRNLAGRLSASSSAGKSLLSWGISDGSQGIVYVLHNTNVSSGTVADGVLHIAGLRADQILDIEVWSTAAGTSSPLATLSGQWLGTGNDFTLSLPSFAQDVVVKFKARPSTISTQKLVTIDVGSSIVTFALGSDQQPAARVVDAATGSGTTIDVATLAGFRGRAIDMTPYTTSTVDVHLALTDINHHVWVLHGNLLTNQWWSENLTAGNAQPGMSGDMTFYSPSWGTIHIAGLNALGEAINYWWAPAEPWWHYTNLTSSFGGPTLAGGLTGYVSGWDGLNLAGLDADNNVVVYWWAPGIENINGGDPGKWLTQNMTTDFAGPKIFGQLDAYVTPWGGLNVAGTNAAGEVYTYWWAPGLPDEPNRWRVTNITQVSGGTPVVAGIEVGISPYDGGINLIGIDSQNHLQLMRWKPGDVWRSYDATTSTGGSLAALPLASSASGSRLLVATGGQSNSRSVILFSFFLDSLTWSADQTGLSLAQIPA
ncbi:MAG: sugar-binding protein [Phycisphaerales bacterium]